MSLLNKRISVFWSDEDDWFTGTIRAVEDDRVHVVYDDDDDEWIEFPFDELSVRVIDADDDDIYGDDGDADGSAHEGQDDELNSTREEENEPKINYTTRNDHDAEFEFETDIESQLQKVLNEIKITEMSQDQYDQEEWLAKFLKNRDTGANHSNDEIEQTIDDDEEDYDMSSHVNKYKNAYNITPELSIPSPNNNHSKTAAYNTNKSNDAYLRLQTRFQDPSSTKQIRDRAPQQQQQHQQQQQQQQQQPPSTAVRNASSEGVALLQGCVFSCKDLIFSNRNNSRSRKEMNTYVKVIYISANTPFRYDSDSDNKNRSQANDSKIIKDSITKCKTPIHKTDTILNSTSPIYLKPKFSMEVMSTNIDGNFNFRRDDMGGGVIMFCVYNVDVDEGGEGFVGCGVFCVDGLFDDDDDDDDKNDDENDSDDDTQNHKNKNNSNNSNKKNRDDVGLKPPKQVDRWLKLYTRDGKLLDGDCEIHVALKCYLPSSSSSSATDSKAPKIKNMIKKTTATTSKPKSSKKQQPISSIAQAHKQHASTNTRLRTTLNRKINEENIRLQSRIDKILPPSQQQQQQQCNGRAKKITRPFEDKLADGNGNGSGNKNVTAIEGSASSKLKYNSHVDLSNTLLKNQKSLGLKRIELDVLRSKVNKVEETRRIVSREVFVLIKYLDKHSKSKGGIGIDLGFGNTDNDVEKGKDNDDDDDDNEVGDGDDSNEYNYYTNLEVTVESATLKTANEKLMARRSKHLTTISQVKLFTSDALLEIKRLEGVVELSKLRMNDTKYDLAVYNKQLLIQETKTDIETLEYTAMNGFDFEKEFKLQNASHLQTLNYQKAKEKRKAEKLRVCTFERDRIRQEYKEWIEGDSKTRVLNAREIMDNAVKVLERLDAKIHGGGGGGKK